MFRVRIEALETYRSSIRPVMLSSIRHLNKHFNANQDILTYFNGEAEISRMIGTSFTEKLRVDQETDVGYYNRQFVTAEQDLAGVNDELDSCHRWITNHPFWKDPITNSMIVPMFNTRKYNMSVNRYFKDRVTANQYRDRIQNVLSNPNVKTFSTDVHYPISYQMLECFEDIYLRLVKANIVDGSQTDALTWFKTNCMAPHDVITNLIGNNACFVFKRSLDDISLLFNGVNIARVSKGRYQGQHLVTLEYSFYLSEHTRYELHYPLVVHQQMTNPLFIPEVPVETLDDYPTYQFYEATMALSHKEVYEYKQMPYMYVFPKEDNWRPPVWAWMDLELQRLTLLEDIENQLLLNLFLFNGEDTFWDATFKKYLKKFYNKVTIRHRNPMHLRLWSDDIPVVESHFKMNEDGDLYLSHKPTMSAVYRICFYLDNAVWAYDDECVRDIIEDEEYGRWILDKIIPFIPLPGDKLYPGDKKPGDWPWIDWNQDVLEKLPNGSDRELTDERKIYMTDALLIATNEVRKYNKSLIKDISATEYLRRK